jgi:hypothetical protein
MTRCCGCPDEESRRPDSNRGPLHYEGWGKPSQRGSGVVRPLDFVKGSVGHRWAGKPARKPARNLQPLTEGIFRACPPGGNQPNGAWTFTSSRRTVRDHMYEPHG